MNTSFHRKTWFCLGFFSLFIALFLLTLPSFVAAEPASVTATPPAVPAKPAAQSSVPAAQQAAPRAASAVSGVTEAAVRGGVLACARRIEQVSKYLTGSNQSGAYLFLPAQRPDHTVFSASFELQPAAASGPMYASASFSPDAEGGCGAVYDAVEYSTRACAEVQKTAFPAVKSAAPLRKDISIMDAGAVKIFFMPAGSGCVIIKKEVLN